VSSKHEQNKSKYTEKQDESGARTMALFFLERLGAFPRLLEAMVVRVSRVDSGKIANELRAWSGTLRKGCPFMCFRNRSKWG
jgi:hypothetical protein